MAALRSSPRPRVVWFELLLLLLFAGISAWVLALDLAKVASDGTAWNGTTSPYPIDQLQYLSWIRDAAIHLLASNLFVLRATPHDYLEPMVIASAGLVGLGVAPAIALLIWQPVAIVAVFGTARSLVHRQLTGHVEIRVALCLALFAGLPSMQVDLWLPFWGWGYQVALLALACSLGSLLAYDRARQGGRGAWVAAPLGALASWLHPWQGEVLVILIAGGEAAMWFQGQRPRVLRVVPVIAVSVLPLVYYGLLQRIDVSWRLGQLEAAGPLSLRSLPPLAPVVLPALLAYRLRPLTFLQAATRVWPLAALAVFFLAEAGLGSSPPHAFLGISIPLAILGVEGVFSLRSPARHPAGPFPARRHRRPSRLAVAAGTLAVLALGVPAAVSKLSLAHHLVGNIKQPRPDELRALRYLDQDPLAGGVLTGIHLGAMVPMDTGRHTYLGDCYWSLPNCPARNTNVWLLFNWGKLQPARAEALVFSTGARFLLKDCRAHGHLWREVRGIVVATRRFGCATVYEVERSGGRPT